MDTYRKGLVLYYSPQIGHKNHISPGGYIHETLHYGISKPEPRSAQMCILPQYHYMHVFVLLQCLRVQPWGLKFVLPLWAVFSGSLLHWNYGIPVYASFLVRIWAPRFYKNLKKSLPILDLFCKNRHQILSSSWGNFRASEFLRINLL